MVKFRNGMPEPPTATWKMVILGTAQLWMTCHMLEHSVIRLQLFIHHAKAGTKHQQQNSFNSCEVFKTQLQGPLQTFTIPNLMFRLTRLNLPISKIKKGWLSVVSCGEIYTKIPDGWGRWSSTGLPLSGWQYRGQMMIQTQSSDMWRQNGSYLTKGQLRKYLLKGLESGEDAKELIHFL